MSRRCKVVLRFLGECSIGLQLRLMSYRLVLLQVELLFKGWVENVPSELLSKLLADLINVINSVSFSNLSL